MRGYPNSSPSQFMNATVGDTPQERARYMFSNKSTIMAGHGDYGPVSSVKYYTPQNPTYPYPLDSSAMVIKLKNMYWV